MNNGAVVRQYLAQLAQPKRKGKPVDVNRKLAAIVERLEAATDPVTRLSLVQQRMDLEAAATNGGHDWTEEFVAVAFEYAVANSISYPAWREVGVPAAVLKRAGIQR